MKVRFRSLMGKWGETMIDVLDTSNEYGILAMDRPVKVTSSISNNP
jgi:hypothetical protein